MLSSVYTFGHGCRVGFHSEAQSYRFQPKEKATNTFYIWTDDQETKSGGYELAKTELAPVLSVSRRTFSP